MLPQTQPRKKANSSKVNLLISFVFHAVLVLALLYFAAREGLLGKQMKKISVDDGKGKAAGKTKGTGKPKVEPPKDRGTAQKWKPPKVVKKPSGSARRRAAGRGAAGRGIAVV